MNYCYIISLGDCGPYPPPPPVHKSDDPCISPGRFGLRIGLMHRPTYTPVLCTSGGEKFF